MAPIRVCIIGAGMSGLSACKHLLQRGLDPVVLEASDGVGGLWRHTFATTRLQTPAVAYQFSDFPWPQGTPDYPHHAQVLDYLESYARNFNLLERIQFNSKVVGIQRLAKDQSSGGLWGKNNGLWANDEGSNIEDDDAGVWEVHVERKRNASMDANDTSEDGVVQRLRFDFLVMCIGRFGDVPRIPSFPTGRGPEIFRGKVIHAMEYSRLDDQAAVELLRDKRVVVVGLQKSAIDVAAEAADANPGIAASPCTLVYRKAHWMVPNYEPWGVPLAYLYCTRFSELFIPKPDQGLLMGILSTFFAPTRWAISKFVELYLLWSLPLREYGLVPKHSFYEQLSSCLVSTLPESFFAQVKQGRIRLVKSPNWSFSANGVVLDSGTEVEADVVILATGYDGDEKLASVLPNPYKKHLQDECKVLPLYRGIIHPRIPDIAILGYQESLSNLRSSEMGARWIAYLLSGRFHLPDIKTMEKETRNWIKYMKDSTPFYERACVGAVHIWHTDQLCKDMGWNPKRKKTWFQEFFSPYGNADYQD